MVEIKHVITDKYVLTVDDQKIFVTIQDLREIVQAIEQEDFRD